MAWPTSASAAFIGRRNFGFAISAICPRRELEQLSGALLGREGGDCQRNRPPGRRGESDFDCSAAHPIRPRLWTGNEFMTLSPKPGVLDITPYVGGRAHVPGRAQ